MTDDLELRRQVLELKAEVAALTNQLEGNIPDATWWLQRKVWAQRKALDALNRKVTSQRFYLRTLRAAGRDLTREEYLAAKAQVNEQLQERLDDYEELAKV